MEYEERPIQYGLKLRFADGTVVNWYKDGRKRTVHVECNPAGRSFPPSAQRIDEILAVFDPQQAGRSEGPPWHDAEGRPLGAFDGGADPNPGAGGWGVVLPDDRELCGGKTETTNNRMELTGAIELLKATKGPLRVLGDSRYVIDGITRWILRWRERNWRTVSGSEVENRDLWEKLDKLASGREIVWQHVRGHTGHPLNERCDRLCVQGRRKALAPRAARRRPRV